MTKDAPIALMAQGIPRILKAVSQEPWTTTKYIREIYFGHLSNKIYISYKSQCHRLINKYAHLLLIHILQHY